MLFLTERCEAKAQVPSNKVTTLVSLHYVPLYSFTIFPFRPSLFLTSYQIWERLILLIKTWYRIERGEEEDLQKNAFCLSYFIIIHQCTKLYKSSIVVVVHKRTIFLFCVDKYIIIHKRHLYYINTLFIHFVTHNYHVAVFFLPLLHVYCQVCVERISTKISSSTLCISDTNNSHLVRVHHYTEAKERSHMDRLPPHFPPSNTFPFTTASPLAILFPRCW